MNGILDDFKGNNNFAFGELYKINFRKILSFVLQNNGNKADAEDLFQDAMLVVVAKLRSDNFHLTASIETYIYAICKNLWFKKLRNKTFQLTFDDIQEIEFQKSISDSIENEMNYTEKLKSYLIKITAHCNRLIQDMFYKEKSIGQIKKKYGYSSIHNAQNQKYKCLNQIKKVKDLEEKAIK